MKEKIEQEAVQNVEFYSAIVMNDLNDHSIRGVAVRQDVNNLLIWTTFLVRDFKALQKNKMDEARNAALSEAIEKVMQLTQDRHRKNEPAIFYPSEVNSILEGLKIKP